MKQLVQFLKESVAFHRTHKGVAAMVWLTSSLAASLPTFPLRFTDVTDFVINTILFASFGFYLLMRYLKALEARMSLTDGGATWQVQVNGVTLGEMKDSDYAAIWRSVLCDSRIYVAQLCNFGWAALQIVDYLFKAIPLSLFWITIGCFFFAPNTFAEALAFIQKVTLAQAITAIPMLTKLFILTSFMTFFTHIFFGGRQFGIANQFHQECNSRIRRAMACAAEGKVSLCCIANGKQVFPDEMATIRSQLTTTPP